MWCVAAEAASCMLTQGENSVRTLFTAVTARCLQQSLPSLFGCHWYHLLLSHWPPVGANMLTWLTAGSLHVVLSDGNWNHEVSDAGISLSTVTLMVTIMTLWWYSVKHWQRKVLDKSEQVYLIYTTVHNFDGHMFWRNALPPAAQFTPLFHSFLFIITCFILVSMVSGVRRCLDEFQLCHMTLLCWPQLYRWLCPSLSLYVSVSFSSSCAAGLF